MLVQRRCMRCNGTAICWCRGRGSADEVQRWRGGEVQRCRGAEVQVQMKFRVQKCSRGSGAEVMQRYIGAEVQRCRGA